MNTNAKKLLSLITSLAVAIVMCFGTVSVFADDPGVQGDPEQTVVEEQQTVGDEDAVQAEEETETEPAVEPVRGEDDPPELPVLTIVNQTGSAVSAFGFTRTELEKMATKKATYSGINNVGSVKSYQTTTGIPLTTLMSKSGFKMKSTYELFFDIPGKPASIRWDDLTATRYYYPKLESYPLPGPINYTKATKGKKKVVPVISLEADKLMFGQTYPRDKNVPMFLDGVIDTGVIYIRTAEAKQQCQAPAAEALTPEVDTEVANGTEIYLHDYDSNMKETVYFTTNGKKPTSSSAVYNYNPKNGEVNPIKLEGAGPMKVRILVKGFGKKSSSIVTFKYFVTPELTIIDNTVSKKTEKYFSKKDLESLVTGNRNYSSINNKGSISIDNGVEGVSLTKLMKKAKIKMKSSDMLEFNADKTNALRWGSLTAKRYYYPNLSDGHPIPGPTDYAKAALGKKRTYAAISLATESADSQLYFGQLYPTDKNRPLFYKGIIEGKTITINKGGKLKRWNDVIEPNIPSGETVEVGTEILFPAFDSNTEATLFFTTNGKTPTYKSAIYNYNSKDGVVNPVVLNKAGKVKVKVLEKGFGKKTSKVKTFTYHVVNNE